MTSIDDAIRLLQEIKELGGSVTTTLEKAKPVAKKAKKAAKKQSVLLVLTTST